MRGWCACAVVCAVVALCAGARLEEAAERQLLALLGLPSRPPRRAVPAPPVPAPLQRLYDARAPLPVAAANTARSYFHVPSPLDDRFPHHHRFRLFFNVSVPADELPRGAALALSRAPGAGAQRLLLYDIVRPGRRGHSAPILRLIDSKPLLEAADAVSLDTIEAVRRWLLEPKHNHGLLVRVLDAAGGDAGAPLVRLRRSTHEDAAAWRPLQPTLLLYSEDARARAARLAGETRLTRNKRGARRAHRPHHRRKEAREICQRRPLYVDFEDVGWSDWIVAPHGYDAYYCQGDCPFPLNDHLNGTNHAIVQTLVNSVNPAAVPKACCVPTQLSAISMLFLDEGNNLMLKNYQDMMVVGCGCR